MTICTNPSPVGNVYDKYTTNNPVARVLMHRFLRDITDLYRHVDPDTVLEVGCGEGKLAQHLIHISGPPKRFVASDISLHKVGKPENTNIEFIEASAYKLPYENASFDLVLCCEVLEHLERPQAALLEVTRVAKRSVLLSTPREPIWRILNMLRTAYLRDWGNTPGHIQHFSRRGLAALVSEHIQITEVRTPLPWTIILGSPK